jgi:metal transporter CNNM
VYIDVHKAIRRLTPAPKARPTRSFTENRPGKSSEDTLAADNEETDDGKPLHARVNSTGARSDYAVLPSSPRAALFMRRSSAGTDGQAVETAVPFRANFEELKQHLKHLGPSNPATNPKGTRSTTVKIKHGLIATNSNQPRQAPDTGDTVHKPPHHEDETTRLLRPHVSSKDGMQTSRESYGSTSPGLPPLKSPANSGQQAGRVDEATQTSTNDSNAVPDIEIGTRQSSSNDSVHSVFTDHSNPMARRSYVRSGSITENVVESRGVRKVVLETASSNDDEEVASRGRAGSLLESQKSHSRSTLNIPGDDGQVSEDDTEAESNVAGLGNGASTSEACNPRSRDGGGKKKNRRKKRKGGRP